jgi:hypothetical protein
MTPNDSDAFAEEVKLLAEGLREKLTPDQTAALFLGLLEYGFEDVKAALRRALRKLKWFPTPVEVAELIHANRIDARRAERRATEEGRRKTLPAGPDDEKVRAEALAAIRAITSSLAAGMAPPLPKRTVADMNAEVVRLRALEGKGTRRSSERQT